ncbi:MAG: glycoside hydrolase family 76 protein [Paludibacter sp.]|jgi:predicted alpha-1,6-mannanase (GH76 family)|nr:glycoside hydrolase family 76 protein [Paludibacter sp.]
MKRLFSFSFLFLLLLQLVSATIISSGNVYKITSNYTGNRVLTTENSSLEENAKVFVWTETKVNSQRWRITDAGDGDFYIDNAYSEKRLYAASATSIVQSSLGTSSSYRWSLVPVEGSDNSFYIFNEGKGGYLELQYGSQLDDDGAPLRINALVEPADNRQIWTFEKVDDVPNVLSPEIRTEMMQSWKDRYYAGEVNSSGFWGLAENMEVILDAYEATGKEEYKTMFEAIYKNFINRQSTNWMGNDFNDDIAWAVLASVRAYFMFGNGDLNYLSIARTNFDNMYRRALYKVDDLYYLLRWKEGQGGTTSCVNGPAEIAACYLGIATGVETYFTKAKMLYASQRIHLYEPASGRVYDHFSNNWASTYNQGTYLGAALMLYNHYGDEMYKEDAKMIMQFTENNLCNSSGIVSVEGGETSDLPGFKGILMRYVRRFVTDLGQVDAGSWMQKNAVHVYNNRNSDGITWTSWHEKAKEKDYTDGFGSFTAVSAVMNAPLDLNTIYKDAFSTIQAGSFNYISKVASENNTEGEKLEITSIEEDAYLGYNNVDCKNKFATQIEFEVLNDATERSVEIRLGSPTGSLLSTVQIPASNSSWKTIIGDLDIPLDGKNNVYLVFKGIKNSLRFKSFKFVSSSVVFSDITDNGGSINSSITQTNILNLIDNKISTEYKSSFTTGSSLVLTYNSKVPVNPKSYMLVSGAGSSDYDPSTWKLQASEDGQNWVDLDTQTNQTFGTRNSMKKYGIGNSSQTYSFFRLVLIAIMGNSNKLCLSEWQIFGSSISENDITADGGVLSVQYTSGVENLIDKSIGTKYQVNGQTDFWVQYDATARYKLTSYTLSSADNNASSDPKSWVLYGSDDNSNWTVIDEQDNQLFSERNVTQTYLCSSVVGYKCFKLNVLSANGSTNTQLSEWQLFGDLYFDPYYQNFIQTGDLSSFGVDSITLSKLNDNNPETNCSIDFTDLPAEIICKTRVPVQMQGYSISSSGENDDSDPKSWILQGSKDGQSWSLIDRRTDEVFESRFSKHTYIRTNSNAYSYFKLTVSDAKNATSNKVNISDWELIGVSVSAYDVTYNPGGIITAQFVGNYDVDKNIDERFTKLIDKDKAGKYCIDYRKTFWSVYQSARPVKLNAYSLTSANDAPERDPKEWKLYGSKDNKNWTLIDYQKDQVFSYRYTTNYYVCSNTEKYSYYKLDVISNSDGKSVQLGEWQLFGEFNEYSDDITDNGGVLTASVDADPGSVLSYLTDNNETTKYLTNISTTSFGDGIWFKYESVSPALLTSYTLTSSNDNPNNDPKDWVLQGSNDDENWTELDAQTGVAFDSRSEKKVFQISTSTEYKYFRLFVSEKKSAARGFQLAEWELFGTFKVAVKNVERDILSLYPNPATDNVMVFAPEESQLTICDFKGLILHTQTVQPGNTSLNLSELQQGMYLVSLKSENYIYSEKLIKK